MDGPRLDPSSRQARDFARRLIESSAAASTATSTTHLGSRTLRLDFSRIDDVTSLIRDSFHAHATTDSPKGKAEFTVSVVRREDVGVLRVGEWARHWVETAAEVPAHLSYPYRIFFDRIVGIVYVLDQSSGHGAVWIRDDAELDLRSFITPFRLILSWMANTVAAEVVHASSATVEGRTIAFVGAAGSGKSTLALALGLSGYPMISDDCLVLEGGRVYSVYRRAKVDDFSQALLDIPDRLLTRLPHALRAKAFVTLPCEGFATARDGEIAAFALPVLATRAGFYPLTPRRAHRMIAKDSLREVMGGRTRNHLRIARAVSSVPSFRLTLTPSVQTNVESVRSLVAGLVDTSGASGGS